MTRILGLHWNTLHRFGSLESNTLDVVLWSFITYRYSILCVIRKDQTATILDSLGPAPSGNDSSKKFRTGWKLQRDSKDGMFS
jgi:hypothetical protein